MPLTKKQKTTALVAYILGLLVFFAVVLFPDKTVRDFTESSLARFSPKVTVKVGQAGPAFPFSVKLKDFLVYYDHQPVAAAGYVKLTPTVSTLLGLGTAGSFKIDLFGGGLNGSSRLEDSGAYRTEARLDDLRLEEMAFLESFFRHQLDGQINGQVETRTGKGQMKATAELELSDGRIRFAAPVFGIEEMRFDTVTAVIEVEGSRVRLSQCDISGPDMSGRVSGDFIINKPLAGSRLNLKGEVRPHASLVSRLGKQLPVDILIRKNQDKSGFPVRIRGTFENPELSLQ